MLKLIKIQDPQFRWNLLSQFHPQSECYVVSDIKTKMAVEEFLLKKYGSLPGSSVFRIKEFLKEIFYRMESHWHLVPESFLHEVFSDFSLSHKETFIQNSCHAKDFLLYFYRFLPLLIHPEGPDLMKEWITSKKKDKESVWMHWWNLSQEFFHIVNDKKTLSEEGLKRILTHNLHSLTSSFLPFKKVIFDLGVPSDQWEQEFLKELSKKHSVELIAPHFVKKDICNILNDKTCLEESDFQEIKLVDNLLSEKLSAKTKDKFSSDQQKSSSLLVKKRWETSLIEVKESVAQVRNWLNQGVTENEIALLAPDIENYWFCLKPHLNQEGISYKKSHSVTLIDYPEILFWFSELQLHLGFLTFTDLETKYFYTNPVRSFSEFHSLFAKVPEREFSKKLLNKKKIKSSDAKIKGKEFIRWSASFWPKTGRSELLELALKSFQEFPLEAELRWGAWLKILKSNLFSSTRELEEESPQGISCLSLNALHSIRGSHVLIMGLDQDSLLSPLSSSRQEDMEALSNDLGFPLSFPNPKQMELNLFWFLQSSSLKEVILSVADMDFSGSHRTASSLWRLYGESFLEKENKKSSVKKGELTTQKNEPLIIKMKQPAKKPKDMLQQKKSLKNVQFKNISTIDSLVSNSHWNKESEDLSISLKKNKRQFSGASLKKYAECPFAYAVKYDFNLYHTEKADREVSPLETGTLTHYLLKKLLNKKNFLNWKDNEVTWLVDHLIETIKKKEIKSVHNNQWSIIKTTLKEIALRFLEKEALLFKKIPSLQVLGQELKLECYWEQEKRDFSQKGDFLFKGFIDRLDYEPSTQSYYIRDYKSSVSQINHIDRWIEKKEIQLLLYALILENGLIKELPKGKVRALSYYSYKDFNHKGYVEEGSLFEEFFGNRWQGKKGRKVLETIFRNLKEEIHNILNSIDNREFSPKPFDEKICEKCSWRKWCRAPHLN